jgi:signal transduction histidine kinase/ActR/RegA family two-component response regulator
MKPDSEGLFSVIKYHIVFVFAIIFFLTIILLPFFWHLAQLNHANSGPYINLRDYPVYLKSGFNIEDTNRSAVLALNEWKMINSDPIMPVALKIKNSGLPDLPKRHFLSPARERAQEFTLQILFPVGETYIEQFEKYPLLRMGIFFAGIGDNWQIFLNGRLIKSEVHLDGNGEIISHRSYHHVRTIVPKSIFRLGNNILTVRIIGDPTYENTGFFIASPYYLGSMEAIESRTSEAIVLAFCGTFIFLGVYHLLLFILRREEQYNLSYAIFSMLLGTYLFLRSITVFSILADTNILLRIDMAVLFMLLPSVAAFAELFNFKKIFPITKFSIFLCLIMTLLEISFPLQFGEDILKIWQVLAIPGALYIAIHDFFYVFLLNANKKRLERKNAGVPVSFIKSCGITLIFAPIGNMMFGVVFLLITSILDIFDALIYHNNLSTSRYGFFAFTIAIAFVLARKFAGLYKELNHANIALESVNANLEATVSERTHELEVQTRLAESASRAKSDFLARMSHEIRTPLNAIIGLAEVELRKKPSGETGENLEEMHSSGTVLLSIINDLLDISKIESGKMKLAPVEYNLLNLLGFCVNLNIIRIGSKPILFEADIDETLPQRLSGDETRVKQILNNLLSNAFKYTEKGKVILKVRGERTGRDKNITLICSIEDTGKGIRDEDIGKLFFDYQRLDEKENRNIEGTGLGLSITKKLAEAMGGSITVESVYGKGSVFTVRICQQIIDDTTLGKSAADIVANQNYQSTEWEKSKNIEYTKLDNSAVLLVDDVVTNLKVAQGLLRPYGMNIILAKSGAQAIKIIRESEVKFDAIFMDHMMPEMDGIEAVKIIRNEIDGDYAKTVPIIALTANAIVGNDRLFLDNGFQDFLSKPINVIRLDEVIHRWVIKDFLN